MGPRFKRDQDEYREFWENSDDAYDDSDTRTPDVVDYFEPAGRDRRSVPHNY